MAFGSVARSLQGSILLALLSAAACGDASTEGGGGAGGDGAGGSGAGEVAPLFESGARLRAMVADAGAGATLFRSFWDTELQVACRFVPLADGSLGCAPSSSSVVAYADSDCSEPVAIYFANDCSDGPEHYHYQPIDFPADACDESFEPGYRLFETGASRGVGQAYFQSAAGCTLGPSTEELFDVKEVEPSALVLAEQRVEERGALGAVVLEAQDGAKQIVGLRDRVREQACQPLELVAESAPSRPCVGRSATLGTNAPYVNAACSGGRSTLPACPGPVAIVVENETDECAIQQRTLYEVGERADPPYSQAEDACVELPLDGLAVYGLGPKLDNNVLPALTVTLLGSNRLRVRALSAGNDVPISATGLYDSAGGQSCATTVVLVADPTTAYCLGPEAAAFDYNLFTDAACSKPVVLHDPGACDRPAPSIGLARADLQGCDDLRIAHALVPWDGDFFTGLAGGDCQPLERSRVVLPGMSAFAQGDEIALDPELSFVLRTE